MHSKCQGVSSMEGNPGDRSREHSFNCQKPIVVPSAGNISRARIKENQLCIITEPCSGDSQQRLFVILQVILGNASSLALLMAQRKILCGRTWILMTLSGKVKKNQDSEFGSSFRNIFTDLFHLHSPLYVYVCTKVRLMI